MGTGGVTGYVNVTVRGPALAALPVVTDPQSPAAFGAVDDLRLCLLGVHTASHNIPAR